MSMWLDLLLVLSLFWTMPTFTKPIRIWSMATHQAKLKATATEVGLKNIIKKICCHGADQAAESHLLFAILASNEWVNTVLEVIYVIQVLGLQTHGFIKDRYKIFSDWEYLVVILEEICLHEGCRLLSIWLLLQMLCRPSLLILI